MTRTTSIFISLLLSFLIVILFLWPKYQDFQGLRLEISKKSLELKYKEEYFSNLNRTSKELEKFELSLSKIDMALPSSLSMPFLFEYLQKMSSQSGLVLKNIGFSQSAIDARGIKEIKIPLSLSGSYLAFKEFLIQMENSAMMFEIDDLSFSLAEAKNNLFNISLNARTRSY